MHHTHSITVFLTPGTMPVYSWKKKDAYLYEDFTGTGESRRKASFSAAAAHSAITVRRDAKRYRFFKGY